jgi:hypothetical protein
LLRIVHLALGSEVGEIQEGYWEQGGMLGVSFLVFEQWRRQDWCEGKPVERRREPCRVEWKAAIYVLVKNWALQLGRLIQI